MFHYQINEDLVIRQLQMSDANALFRTVEKSRGELREWLPWIETTKKTGGLLSLY